MLHPSPAAARGGCHGQTSERVHVASLQRRAGVSMLVQVQPFREGLSLLAMVCGMVD